MTPSSEPRGTSSRSGRQACPQRARRAATAAALQQAGQQALHESVKRSRVPTDRPSGASSPVNPSDSLSFQRRLKEGLSNPNATRSFSCLCNCPLPLPVRGGVFTKAHSENKSGPECRMHRRASLWPCDPFKYKLRLPPHGPRGPRPAEGTSGQSLHCRVQPAHGHRQLEELLIPPTSDSK